MPSPAAITAWPQPPLSALNAQDAGSGALEQGQLTSPSPEDRNADSLGKKLKIVAFESFYYCQGEQSNESPQSNPWTCIIGGVIIWPKLSALQWFILPCHRYVNQPLCPFKGETYWQRALDPTSSGTKYCRNISKAFFFVHLKNVFCHCVVKPFYRNIEGPQKIAAMSHCQEFRKIDCSDTKVGHQGLKPQNVMLWCMSL